MESEISPHDEGCGIGKRVREIYDETNYICTHPGEEVVFYECVECGSGVYFCNSCNMPFFDDKDRTLFKRLREVVEQ